MGLRAIAAACFAALILATASACGSDSTSGTSGTAASTASDNDDRAEQAAKARRERARYAREKAAYDECTEQTGDLTRELSEMDSRLDVGLSYDEYTDFLADAKVAYDDIDFDASGVENFDCISQVGLPLEKAINQYLAAARVWGDCFDDYSCDTDSIEPRLQSRWSRAHAKVEQAKDGLDDLEPEEPKTPEPIAGTTGS